MSNSKLIRQEFGLIIISSFIFLASYLWKDFITELEEYFFPAKKNLVARFFYNFALTIVIVLIALLITNFLDIEYRGANTVLAQTNGDIPKDTNNISD